MLGKRGNNGYTKNEILEICKKQNVELLDTERNSKGVISLHILIDGKYTAIVPAWRLSKGITPTLFNSKRNSYTIENVKVWLQENRHGYKLLSTEIEGKTDYIEFICNKGHRGKIKWGSMYYKNAYCNVCKHEKTAARCRLQYEDVKEYIEDKGYSLLSEEYLNDTIDLKLRCPEGHIFYMDYNHFKRGHRCTVCKGSSGELDIQNFLKSNNITYEREYMFSNLRGVGNNPLRFDFIIPNNNVAIEFNGSQHYYVKNFGGESMEDATKKFNILKEHDARKIKYCKENNIKLLVIPFTKQKDINNILNQALLKNNSAFFVA